MDNDFPKLLRFDSAKARSPAQRAIDAEEWIKDIESVLPLTGYDRNVLQQWRDGGYRGSPPKLSIEIAAPYTQEAYMREEERMQALLRLEQKAYESWLLQGQKRAEAEREARLLRDYPVSYREHLAALEKLKQEQRLLNAERLRKELEEKAKADRIEAEAEAEREAIHRKAIRYIKDPLNEMFTLTEMEYMLWCETIATPELLEDMTKALAIEGREYRKPQWLRTLERCFRNDYSNR